MLHLEVQPADAIQSPRSSRPGRSGITPSAPSRPVAGQYPATPIMPVTAMEIVRVTTPGAYQKQLVVRARCPACRQRAMFRQCGTSI